MIGAVIVRHWRMGPHKTILFILFITLTTLISNSVYLMSCPSPKIVGLNVGYDDSTQSGCVKHFEAQLTHMRSSDARLEAACNDHCQCRQADYRPVCSREFDLTFYSPCVAGCHAQEQDNNVGIEEQFSLAADALLQAWHQCDCLTNMIMKRYQTAALAYNSESDPLPTPIDKDMLTVVEGVSCGILTDIVEHQLQAFAIGIAHGGSTAS